MIYKVTSLEQYNELTKDGNCLVDFFATWCGPCKMLAPILEDADRLHEFGDTKIIEVDIDVIPALTMKYQIQAVPTLLSIKNGQVANQTMGYQTLADLKKFLQ